MKPITPFAIIVSTALLFACGKSEEAAAPVPPPVTEATEATQAEAVEPAPVESVPAAVEPAPAEVAAPAQPEAAAPPAAKPVAPVAASKPEAAPPAAAPAVAAPAAPVADLVHGQKIYRQACAYCHDRGVANAPKTGDVATWDARLAKGMEAVYSIAIKGKGAMPPRGGNPSLTDADVNAAVDYMIAKSR
jgi:cytochrome c5